MEQSREANIKPTNRLNSRKGKEERYRQKSRDLHFEKGSVPVSMYSGLSESQHFSEYVGLNLSTEKKFVTAFPKRLQSRQHQLGSDQIEEIGRQASEERETG